MSNFTYAVEADGVATLLIASGMGAATTIEWV